jgi:hypothetical protein
MRSLSLKPSTICIGFSSPGSGLIQLRKAAFRERIAPVLLYWRHLAGRDQQALSFYLASGLRVVVAITQVRVPTHQMTPEIVAALVGAGMLSLRAAIKGSRPAGDPSVRSGTQRRTADPLPWSNSPFNTSSSAGSALATVQPSMARWL